MAPMAVRRSNHHGAYAVVGVVVLLVTAVVAGVLGVRAFVSVVNANAESRLRRYVQHSVVVRVDIPRAGASFEFPTMPVHSQEAVALPSGVVVADRYISASSADSMELVWFPASSAITNAPSLAQLAPGIARALGGTVAAPILRPASKPPSYEFAVVPDKSAVNRLPNNANTATRYYVRLLLDRGIVDELRVRSGSPAEGRAALSAFAASYRPLLAKSGG